MARLSMGGASYNGPKEIRYLFIDGGFLDNVLRDFGMRYFSQEEIPIDYSRISAGYTKAFYYHSLPTRKKLEEEQLFQEKFDRKKEFFRRLNLIPGYHVYDGDSRLQRKRQVQKGVDTMIAIDMLRHTFRGNMHSATLVAGDLDFKPLLKALVEEGMYVNLWYDKKRTSEELLMFPDASHQISIENLKSFIDDDHRDMYQLPEWTRTSTSSLPFTMQALIPEMTGALGEHKILIFNVDIERLYYFIMLDDTLPGEVRFLAGHNLDTLQKYAEDSFGEEVIWD